MTVWTPTDTGHADLGSHDSFLAGPPHNTFKRLRDEDPMHWSDWSGGKGFWSVTRHADILELNRNHQRLSSAQGIRMEDQTHEEYMARRTFQETDPPEHTIESCMHVSDVLARVGGKWSILIIGALGPGPRRFNELKREVQGISQRMLTLAVRGLERDGLIARTVTPSIPPRVDYALTDLGRSLLKPVSALGEWAIENRALVERARHAFDVEAKS